MGIVASYPDDVQFIKTETNLRQSTLFGVLTELRHWKQSCGYALDGYSDFGNMLRFEVIACDGDRNERNWPGASGHNISQLSRLCNNSNIVPCDTAHAEVMLVPGAVERFIVPSVIRILHT